MNCNIPQLKLPLMALIDYRGFRLVAMSKLPIDPPRSIVHGSANAGITIHSSNSELRGHLRRTAEILNLQTHVVGEGNQRCSISTALDVEGHIGSEGKFYLVDFSRTLPCVPPRERFCNLYELFRPEFVKDCEVPLCPDAYSGFIKDESQKAKYVSEIESGYKILTEKKIPLLAGRLPSLVRDDGIVAFRMTETLHSRGINIRYLGLVMRALNRKVPMTEDMEQLHQDARCMLLGEMTARVLANMLREKWREKMRSIQAPLEEPYRRLTINFLNTIFGNNKRSRMVWKAEIKPALEKKFCCVFENASAYTLGKWPPDCLKDAISDFGEKTHKSPTTIGWWLLFRRIKNILGLQFSADFLHSLSSDHRILCSHPHPFSQIDLISIGQRVKTASIVPQAEGYTFMLRAHQSRVTDPSFAIRCFQTALNKFEECLDRNRNNQVILRNCGHVLEYISYEEGVSQRGGKVLGKIESILAYHKKSGPLQRANSYYRAAIHVDPFDPRSHLMYARFLDRFGNTLAAELHYLCSLELDSHYVESLLHYGHFLQEKGELEYAEQFYLKAKKCGDLLPVKKSTLRLSAEDYDEE